ncbi:MAG: EAL domain-containing protein [Rhodospirillales bacterium]|nr:EAL domain-containing protein [Rhodospirillales bacterium]
MRRLDDITRLVSDWVWETDEEFRLTFLSFRVFEVLGFHSLELVGRRMTDLGTFSSEDGTPIELNWKSPFRDIALEIEDRNGSRKHFRVSGLPMYSPESGAFTGVLGTARDVTLHRRAELALRESEYLLRTLVANVPVILFSLDLDGVFVLSEGRSLSALGLSPGEAVGKSVFDLYGNVPEVGRCFRRAVAGEIVQAVIEYDGSTFQCTFSPIRDEQEKITGVIGVAANITGRARAQSELRESEERFRNLIEGSLLGIVIDHHGKPAFANQAFAQMFGYQNAEQILELDSLDSVYQAHEKERIRTYRNDRMAGRPAPTRYEFAGIKRDGTPILLETQVRAVTWKGRPAVQSTIIDITDRQRMLDNLRQLSQAVEQSPASVIITDTDGAIEYVNDKFVRITGYTAEEAIGKNPRILNSGKTPPERFDEMWRALGAGLEWRGEFLNKKKNGDLFWEYASISPIKDLDGTTTHYLAVKEDITLRKEYEKRLIQQANFDEMTGLPNRGLAVDRLFQATARCARENSKVGLLFIDLDRFKAVNDTLGHASGDLVLKEAGERIKSCLRAGDTVARLGGDEFTVILPGLAKGIDAESVAQKILETFRPAFLIEGREVFLSASVGITIWPDDGADRDQLLGNADSAMYQAKELGRNNFRFFTPELNEKALGRARMENQIRHALERGEFELNYQPMVDLRSGRMIRVEALIRWNNPELGRVGPDQFIPLAEEIGLIGSIGEWVMTRACRQAEDWRVKGIVPERISINVSSRQFRGPGLIEMVLGALDKTRIQPDNLELEITENLLMGDIPEIRQLLSRLRQIGVSLSIDDFGTGYSSLSYLRRFPVNVLKIDKSFVQDVTTDSDSAALVEAIINMARSLGLEVVAEGVETDGQMDFLRACGCDVAQGYYFSKPIPGDRFETLVREWDSAAYIGKTDRTSS